MNDKSKPQIVCFIGLVMSTLVGCQSGPVTLLELYHDGKNTASYAYDKTYYRDSAPASGAVEIVGYGFIPFTNGPMDIHYDPRWPPSGFVTFWIHGVPEADGRYSLMLLGPSEAIGPGDDEVLSGVAERAVAKSEQGGVRTIQVSNVPIKSRNHPNEKFTMSGTIIAKPMSANDFDGKLREFNQQLSYRGPLISQ